MHHPRYIAPTPCRATRAAVLTQVGESLLMLYSNQSPPPIHRGCTKVGMATAINKTGACSSCVSDNQGAALMPVCELGTPEGGLGVDGGQGRFRLTVQIFKLPPSAGWLSSTANPQKHALCHEFFSRHMLLLLGLELWSQLPPPNPQQRSHRGGEGAFFQMAVGILF